MVSAMVTALEGGRTAGAGAGAHLMATEVLQPMGAAQALGMTAALVPKALVMMKTCPSLRCSVPALGCNVYIFSFKTTEVY